MAEEKDNHLNTVKTEKLLIIEQELEEIKKEMILLDRCSRKVDILIGSIKDRIQTIEVQKALIELTKPDEQK